MKKSTKDKLKRWFYVTEEGVQTFIYSIAPLALLTGMLCSLILQQCFGV